MKGGLGQIATMSSVLRRSRACARTHTHADTGTHTHTHLLHTDEHNLMLRGFIFTMNTKLCDK